MQDGAESGADASAWLREHFKDDPKPEVTLTWTPGPPMSRAKRARLLEILFGPESQDEAA